jgi:hypothetical protein
MVDVTLFLLRSFRFKNATLRAFLFNRQFPRLLGSYGLFGMAHVVDEQASVGVAYNRVFHRSRSDVSAVLLLVPDRVGTVEKGWGLFKWRAKSRSTPITRGVGGYVVQLREATDVIFN